VAYLDRKANISQWQVDTDTEDKKLSVSGTNVNPQKVENALQEAGFKAEVLRIVGASGEGL
jgi:hypothetical protein